MSIREANEQDLDHITELGSRSLQDGPYAGIIDDVPAQARKCALWVMQAGKILVAEEAGRVVGLLGFIVTPQFFSGELHGAEIMWYLLPEYRQSLIAVILLRASERIAREMGAKSMVFAAPNDDVARMYELLGYSKLETNYRKVL